MADHIDTGIPVERRFPFLSIMHPAHISYIRHQPYNSLDYFFSLLDSLDSRKRLEIMATSFADVALWQSGAGGSSRSYFASAIQHPEVAYEDFKTQCRIIVRNVSHYLLIAGLVHTALSYIFNLGDKTNVEDVKNRLVGIVEQGQRDEVLDDDSMHWWVNHIENAPENAEAHYALYVYFCENVVQQLLEER